ncbi:hypothetical protein [Virgibacillus alimentarius]|uniref:Hydrolase n=1 Tax=Virgibacillus alimentarius TaxID=698769 RepID=A0ABS4S8G0_9BACI|nr:MULTISPECIES: hypothetical protein [Virgibacillus]MBP2257285.1 hypothetical protein [Virgibacillus alimentarius]HLR67848.1 hydrolase [Virgibacillus sp.]
MERKRYYVNVGTHEISQIPYGNNSIFTIYATDEEISILRAKMDNMHGAGIRSFFRAHVPILAYHKDKSNDDYDFGLNEALQLIYGLGDEQTKAHIESMNVLKNDYM